MATRVGLVRLDPPYQASSDYSRSHTNLQRKRGSDQLPSLTLRASVSHLADLPFLAACCLPYSTGGNGRTREADFGAGFTAAGFVTGGGAGAAGGAVQTCGGVGATAGQGFAGGTTGGK